MDGVLGMALSPYTPGRDRYLYFHALASVTENVMFTSTLRNDTHASATDLDPSDVHVSLDYLHTYLNGCRSIEEAIEDVVG